MVRIVATERRVIFWEKIKIISCVSGFPVQGKSMHSAPSFLVTDFLYRLYGHRVKGSCSETVPKIEGMVLLLERIQVREVIKHERMNKVNACTVIFL